MEKEKQLKLFIKKSREVWALKISFCQECCVDLLKEVDYIKKVLKGYYKQKKKRLGKTVKHYKSPESREPPKEQNKENDWSL